MHLTTTDSREAKVTIVWFLGRKHVVRSGFGDFEHTAANFCYYIFLVVFRHCSCHTTVCAAGYRSLQHEFQILHK